MSKHTKRGGIGSIFEDYRMDTGRVVSRLMWKIENAVLPAPERDRG